MSYVLGSRASIGGVLGRGRGGAAPWWMAAGVTPVAAYAAKGAASLAASYVNLANPGVYDAAPGVAPTWDAVNGWSFNGSTQYLTTGVVPNSAGASMLVRMEIPTMQANAIASAFQTGLRFYVMSNHTAPGRIYGYGASRSVAPAISADCVIAIAGAACYLNGANDGSTGGGSLPTIGVMFGGTIVGNYAAGIIKLAIIYNTTLSAAQVATQSAAMAAL